MTTVRSVISCMVRGVGGEGRGGEGGQVVSQREVCVEGQVSH